MNRILLAEDDLGSRELIEEMLGFYGYEVVAVSDGQEALDRIEEVDPAVVLLDIQMPNLDGIETMKRIRAMPRFATIPILAISAYAMRGDREDALARGFTAHISKPVDPDHLFQQVTYATWLRQSGVKHVV